MPSDHVPRSERHHHTRPYKVDSSRKNEELIVHDMNIRQIQAAKTKGELKECSLPMRKVIEGERGQDMVWHGTVKESFVR